MKVNRSLRNRIKGWIPKEPLQPRRIGAINLRSHITLILTATLLVSSIAVSYMVYFDVLSSTKLVTPIVDSNPSTTEGLKLHDWIYIMPDGSLWPNASANILKRDGSVYTFTQNISNSIIIEKDGVTLDGAGYFSIGPGNGEAIMMLSSNSTVKNIKMVDWDCGIHVSGNCCVISGNYIKTNIGLLLRGNHLNVTENHIVNHANNKIEISNPAIERWKYGVYIEPESSFNVSFSNFSNNQIINFTGAIRMNLAFGNTIINNNIVENSIGIEMRGCSNNVFSENNVTQCTVFAISAFRSNNNIFYSNNFINNAQQAVDACSYTLIRPEFSSNIWDNGTVGNFWSNYPIEYQQTPQNPPKICAPYQLYANNTDHYPLAIPTFFQTKDNLRLTV